jgi:hypothetical protein
MRRRSERQRRARWSKEASELLIPCNGDELRRNVSDRNTLGLSKSTRTRRYLSRAILAKDQILPKASASASL